MLLLQCRVDLAIVLYYVLMLSLDVVHVLRTGTFLLEQLTDLCVPLQQLFLQRRDLLLLVTAPGESRVFVLVRRQDGLEEGGSSWSCCCWEQILFCPIVLAALK